MRIGQRGHELTLQVLEAPRARVLSASPPIEGEIEPRARCGAVLEVLAVGDGQGHRRVHGRQPMRIQVPSRVPWSPHVRVQLRTRRVASPPHLVVEHGAPLGLELLRLLERDVAARQVEVGEPAEERVGDDHDLVPRRRARHLPYALDVGVHRLCELAPRRPVVRVSAPQLAEMRVRM